MELSKFIFKNALLILLYSTLNLNFMVSSKLLPVDPEANMNFEQRVEMVGYPISTHKVITEDGYILSCHNIPYGKTESSRKQKNKTPLMLMHGMGGTPQSFLIQHENSFPYYMADRGFDVWLFSARGNTNIFKEQHLWLNRDTDKEYWNYTLHEVAVYDAAASVDYILNYTRQEKLSLLGHSAGGALIFFLLSAKPEYNNKVKVGISWGASPIIKDLDMPIAMIGVRLVNFAKKLFGLLDMIDEVAPVLRNLLVPLLMTLARDTYWAKMLQNMIYIFASQNSIRLDISQMQLLSSQAPRISLKFFLHYMDMINAGAHRQYDYGSKLNVQHYGQRVPPSYNLSAVTAPAAFVLAPSDSFVRLKNVYDSAEHLKTVSFIYEIPCHRFTHLDYIVAFNDFECSHEPTYRILKDVDDGKIPPPITIPSSHYGKAETIL